MVQRERGRGGRDEAGIWPHKLWRSDGASERENASFADDGKEYEFLARQTPPLRFSLAVARGLEGGNFAPLSFEI